MVTALSAVCGALILGSGAAAAADPVRMSLTSKVSAPAKPAITIIADEPLQNLTIALEPAAPEDGGKASGEAGLLRVQPEADEGRPEGWSSPGSGKAGHDPLAGHDPVQLRRQAVEARGDV